MSIDQSTDNETQSRDEADRPDEMSGRWIRDQLKDAASARPRQWANETADTAPERTGEPAVAEQGLDDPLSPIVANLARCISLAVAQPLEDFERLRRQESEATANQVKQHDHRITAAFAALQLVEEASRRLTERVDAQQGPTRETREIVDRLQGRTEELQSEIRREAEQFSSSIGSLRSELEGFAQRLSHVEGIMEQQRSAVARLEASERRRGESLQEMARLMGNVQKVLQPADSNEGNGGE
jgi:DNA repair exonuclease SbcCD ATPase subunit